MKNNFFLTAVLALSGCEAAPSGAASEGSGVESASDVAGDAFTAEAETDLQTDARASRQGDAEPMDPPDVSGGTETASPEDSSFGNGEGEELPGPFDFHAGINPEVCPDLQGGYKEGESLANLEFRTCDGMPYGTDQLCGARATWVFVVHGWCGECTKLSAATEELAKEYREQGVATVQLLVHSKDHQLPVQGDCLEWAEEFGLEETLMLFDPLVKNIFLQESQQTGLSVFLDASHNIVHKGHYYDPDEIRDILDGILGQ